MYKIDSFYLQNGCRDVSNPQQNIPLVQRGVVQCIEIAKAANKNQKAAPCEAAS